MTALNCAGVNRSKIPSGSIRTGLQTPKIPGSKRVGEETTFTGIPSCTTDPARTASRTLRQRTNQAQQIPMNPQNQMPGKTSGTGFRTGGAVSIATGCTVNGWLTSTITIEMFDGAGAFLH